MSRRLRDTGLACIAIAAYLLLAIAAFFAVLVVIGVGFTYAARAIEALT